MSEKRRDVAGTYKGFAQEPSDEVSAYQLTLIGNDSLHELLLPSIREGVVSLNVGGESLVSCVVNDGEWYIESSSAVVLDRSNNQVNTAKVEDGVSWYLARSGNRSILVAEEIVEENFKYIRYRIDETAQLRIGRKGDNDIAFDNPYVSKRHALIVRESGRFRIIDTDSANGLYVNGRRTAAQELNIGDLVCILGLRIIVGTDFLAINARKPRVTITGCVKEVYVPTMPSEPALHMGGNRHCSSGSNLSRTPRRRTPFKPTNVEIEMPPYPLNKNGIPLMLRMGGSAVYGAASAFMGNPMMLLTTMLFPFLTERYTEKQRLEYEERRVAAYTQYLREKAKEIANEQEYEEGVLRENYPEINTVMRYAKATRQLWERRTKDDDFLKLRIGRGEIPMVANVVYPEEKFGLEDDELENRMYELAKSPVMLRNVPIVMDFLDCNYCGVAGKPEMRFEFVKQLITRLALLYSYDEVKIAILARPEDIDRIGFVRYLPHCWNDQRSMRFIGTTRGEAYLVGEALSKELEEDLAKCRQLKTILRERPYYFVIALDKQLQDCLEVLKTGAQVEGNCGMTAVFAYGEVPKDCTMQITLMDDGKYSAVNLKDIEEPIRRFELDPLDMPMLNDVMGTLANTALRAAETMYSLPKTLGFLEMYEVGSISKLNILKRWTESDPVASLAVPVGVDTEGNMFNLDLHQKYQGPHGLVAGMTGSGKSEFLLTYILSLAVNFRPEEVSFLLIDYKGGGLAGAFEDKPRGLVLPHLAGTITNLDGAAIQRSLISLQSEVVRRQKIFNEAKSITGESTMDIYQYQKMHRQGAVSIPVSHLFIVADEFAELKDQQREFLNQLISIARIGRSLGIHLILATQKPGGVVNDQILSNTKFRVCLKVQTKSDSTEMLKRPEAAELQETGRFYLQVGYNELFALGQSAWSGAPYAPQEEVMAVDDESIELIDSVGQNIIEVRPAKPERSNKGSQLSAIVSEIIELAKATGSAAERLWRPPLSKNIDLAGIAKQAIRPLAPIVGMADDPERQEQTLYSMDLVKHNHYLIVGGARSGKTTLIQTMLLSLLVNCTPDEANIYLLDYSSRVSNAFRSFPHCGGVLVDAGENEVDAFFDLIGEITAERKALFCDLGVDNFEAACEIVSMPVIVVVIDNFSGLGTTKKGEAYAYRMDEYLKAGSQYGIKYVVSCNHPAEVNVRARQEIEGRIALQAKDKYEYEEALGCRVTYLPPELVGRGLCVVNGRPLEIQVACTGASLDAAGRIQAFKGMVQELARKCSNSATAKLLPIVDDEITYEEFCATAKRHSFPLGFSLDSAKHVDLPLAQFTAMSIYFGNQDSEQPVIKNILHMAARESMAVIAVGRMGKSLVAQTLQQPHALDVQEYETTAEDMERFIRRLVEDMQARQRMWDEHKAQEAESKSRVTAHTFMRESTKPVLVVFERFEDIAKLSDELTGPLAQLLPKLHEFNMYAVGCFYPSDHYGLANKHLTLSFNRDELAMLFGGRYAEQKCIDLPGEYSRVAEEGPYNRCLMKYRGKYYPMLMPCEEPQKSLLDDDECSIFE